MKEEWRPCKGYEGFYEVSNMGRVRSIAVYSAKYGKVIERKTPRLRQLETSRDGYKRLALSSLPQDTPKEKVIETLEECVNEAIKQGAIKEFDDVLFKRDYKITISADVTDKVYWEVSKKGEPVLLNDDEFKIVSEMVNEINENIKSYLAE